MIHDFLAQAWFRGHEFLPWQTAAGSLQHPFQQQALSEFSRHPLWTAVLRGIQ